MKKNVFHLLPLLLITSTLSIEQCKAMNESASKVPSLVSLAYNKLPELLEKIDKGDASWDTRLEKPIEYCGALIPNLQKLYPEAICHQCSHDIAILFPMGEKIYYTKSFLGKMNAGIFDQGQFVKAPCKLYNPTGLQVFASSSTKEAAAYSPMDQQLCIVKGDGVYKPFDNIPLKWNAPIDNFGWDSSGKRIAFSCSDDNTYTIVDIESDKISTYETDAPISFLSWLPNTERLIMLQEGGKIGFNDVNGKQEWEEKAYPDEEITHIAPINEKLFAKFSTKNGISFIALKDIHDKSFDKNIIPGLGQPLFVSGPSSSTDSVIAASYQAPNSNSAILLLLFINSDPNKSQSRFGRFVIDSKIIKGVWSQKTPLSTFAFITENQKLGMAFLDGQKVRVEYQNVENCDPETLCWHPATSSFVVANVEGNLTKLWKLPYLKPFSPSDCYDLTVAQSLLLTEFQKNKQLKLCPHASSLAYKKIFDGEWKTLAIKKVLDEEVKKRCSECSQHSA